MWDMGRRTWDVGRRTWGVGRGTSNVGRGTACETRGATLEENMIFFINDLHTHQNRSGLASGSAHLPLK